MERSHLLDYLARQIIRIKRPHPLRVAIDGPDAAGKTRLAQELITPLQAYGRPVIRASIDGFHNPACLRHQRGAFSAEGYYYDSFNYSALIESLLAPLGPGGSRCYRSAVFDYRSDSEAQLEIEVAERNSILLFDGVFLLRPELLAQWDYTVFVDAAFETTIRRAEQRDVALFGSVEEVRDRYERRYIPGQRLYFDRCRPRERAKVAIDNNDLQNPIVVKRE